MATLPLSHLDEDRCERIDGLLVPRPLSGDTHSDVQENIRRLLSLQAKTRECFEYHGGDQFLKAQESLQAGPLSVRIDDAFDTNAA